MYIGNDLQIAHPSYKIIDDISSGFNGSTTSFALQVNGATPVPFPISTQQVMISVNGVVQEPDPTGSAGFKLLGSNIVFSSAPANGHAFFGVINAGADYVTAGSEFPDGSATAPSFTFQDDQDTGWFRSGSGAVGYSADGVQTLTFDGNGLTIADGKGLTVDTSTLKVDAANNRVGIQTATPRSILDLGTNADAATISNTPSDYQLGLNAAQSTTGDIGRNIGFIAVNAAKVTAAINSVDGGTNDTTSLAFWTGNGTAISEAMRIDGSGKVGIGVTSPLKALHVKSSGSVLRLETTATTGSNYIDFNDADENKAFIGLGSGGDDSFSIWNVKNDTVRFATNNTERMRIDSSGRLLIGHTATVDTSTYNSNLQVMGTDAHGSSTIIGRFSNDAGAPSLHLTKSRNTTKGSHTIVNDNDVCGNIFWWASDGSDYEQVAQIGAEIDGTPGSGDTPGALTFSTTADGASTSTERMRIDSSGRVGIGNPTLDAELVVKGSAHTVFKVKSNDEGTRAFIQTVQASDIRIGSETNHPVSFYQNGTQRMQIDTSGNLDVSGGTVSDSKGDLRNIPANIQSSAVTLAASDAGKVVGTSSGGWVIPASTFSTQGMTVTLLNRSNSDQTINASALTYLWNTADGANVKASTLTLGARTMATLWFDGADTGYIQAAALTVS